MAMRYVAAVLATMAAVGLAPVAKAADTMEMVVDGVKQGVFKGDSAARGAANQITVTGYSFEELSPRDAATGQATGKRQHKPIVVTKEWDAASPQFLQALSTNENLHSVVLQLSTARAIGGAGSGKSAAAFKITLTNAQVVDVQQTVTTDATSGKLTPSEQIQFVYQKIEIESVAGNTTAIDDWSTPQ